MTRNALVVGCGAIGSKLDEGTSGEVALTHATGYEMHEGTRLVAGVDPDSDRLSAFSSARGVPGYSEIETALAEHDIDLLSVCTPPQTHAEVVDRALDAGVEGILCEKPLGGDSKTARKIVSQCQSSETALLVNYFRRFLPGCQLARAMLNKGIVGSNRRAVMVYNKGFLNNGSHLIDLARFWFGEATDINTTGAETPDGTATFGQTNCHIIHAGNSAYNHLQVDVYGDSGRLQLLDHGRRLEWQTASESPLFEGFRDLGAAGETSTGFEWMCYFVIDEFAAAVDESVSPACDGNDALRTLELCERFLG